MAISETENISSIIAIDADFQVYRNIRREMLTNIFAPGKRYACQPGDILFFRVGSESRSESGSSFLGPMIATRYRYRCRYRYDKFCRGHNFPSGRNRNRHRDRAFLVQRPQPPFIDYKLAPFAAITSRYHRAESLGMRRKVR